MTTFKPGDRVRTQNGDVGTITSRPTTGSGITFVDVDGYGLNPQAWTTSRLTLITDPVLSPAVAESVRTELAVLRASTDPVLYSSRDIRLSCDRIEKALNLTPDTSAEEAAVRDALAAHERAVATLTDARAALGSTREAARSAQAALIAKKAGRS